MSEAELGWLPLARSTTDRDGDGRSAGVPALLAEDGARVLPLHDARALLAAPHELALLEPGRVPLAEPGVYLGRDHGAPVVSIPVDAATAARLVDEGFGIGWGELRLLGAELSDRDAGLFATALAMHHWHEAHRFSPRTGQQTVPGSAGWTRVDPSVAQGGGHEHFPRTDAAIIVAVIDEHDRILLGSNAAWPADRFSVLAGFVEPGESLEAAVQREVMEEAGIAVAHPHYLGSQPWPFPASLMLGFEARVDPPGQLVRADGEEIAVLRWFTRDELSAAVASGEVKLPGGTSIARSLIQRWHGGELGEDRW